jgi:hypothetical protein
MAEEEAAGLRNVCLLPELRGVGGPSSFQYKFMAALRRRGVEAHHDPRDPRVQALLVVAGTRRLGELWRVKRRGVRIVQRLDGMNWIHRRRRTGLRHYLRSEYGNLLLAYIRRFIADHVVYQSEFTRSHQPRVNSRRIMSASRWSKATSKAATTWLWISPLASPRRCRARPAGRWSCAWPATRRMRCGPGRAARTRISG